MVKLRGLCKFKYRLEVHLRMKLSMDVRSNLDLIQLKHFKLRSMIYQNSQKTEGNEKTIKNLENKFNELKN